MKTIKIVYYTLTVIIALMMTFSAYSYLTNDGIKQAFVHLGFPSFFRVELAIAKLVGAAVLLLPVYPRIKEWAYAGFAIVFVSAFVAHVSSGDPASVFIMPVIFLAVLLGSYVSYHKLQLKSYTEGAVQKVRPGKELSKSVAA